MNIILLKHGTKYSADNVNEIYDSLKDYTSANFYCFTEDKKDVIIDCIDIPKKPKLMRWWNKMHLFRKDFEIEGKCVLFDLDIKILSDPFPYINDIDWNYPTFMRDLWKKDKFFRKHSYDTELNSSILAWTSRENSYIWDIFSKNIDYNTRKYKGIDRFFWHEKIQWRTFDNGIYDTIDLSKNN